MTCRVCGSNETSFFQAKEMVLGTRAIFEYATCAKCSTIQIVQIPENLGDYYPSEYYSLQTIESSASYGKLKARLLTKRDLHVLGVKPSFLGKIIQSWKPAAFDSMYLAYAFVYNQLQKRKNIRIHDAGCGNGFFLKYFHDLGFTHLSGSDPFLAHDLSFGNYIVEKKGLNEVQNTFDVLLLNHVIEHVIDPVSYLKTVYERLNPGGECLIRTPMSTSVGSEKYKEHWVGLEPPRHLHIFNDQYFKSLAESLGFECYAIRFDAIGWHYEASEAYVQDIALNEIEQKQPFSESQLKSFHEMALEANAENRGDTVAYYLKKH